MGIFIFEFYRKQLANNDVWDFAVQLYNEHPEWYNETEN